MMKREVSVGSLSDIYLAVANRRQCEKIAATLGQLQNTGTNHILPSEESNLASARFSKLTGACTTDILPGIDFHDADLG